MITQERLKEVLYYHPESGDWVWLVSQGCVKAGTQAGAFHAGYTRMGVDGKSYLGHRLAFLYMTGAFPLADTDHEDVQRGNGCWDNLRGANRSQNRANIPTKNKWGKGVQPHGNKFRASIRLANKKSKHLGLFATAQAAGEAFAVAARERHGRFARVSP